MHVPFVVCHVLHVEALKLIIYSNGQSVLWDQRAIAHPLFLNPKIAVMHWSDPKPYSELFVLLCSLDFGFMIWLKELILTKQVTYSNSLAL